MEQLHHTRFPHRLRASVITTLGSLLLVAAWWLVARHQLEYILPGPTATVSSLGKLVGEQSFYTALGLTLARSIGGLIIACAIGVAWGCASGVSRTVSWLTTTAMQLLLATPPIIFVILGLTWLGSNGWVAVMVVAMVTTPIVAAATEQAIIDIDARLVEMAKVFRLPTTTTIAKVIYPMVAPQVLTSMTVALGLSIKVGVMAELLATTTGIGGAIHTAQININTPQVFAYALVLIAITFLLEKTIIAPLKAKLNDRAIRA